MKKLISILLVIILTFAFVGCNGKSKEAEVKVGKDQITIDKITYYNTGNIAESTPEESTIKEIEVSSGTTPIANAYAIIETDKMVYCRINGEWYIFYAN